MWHSWIKIFVPNSSMIHQNIHFGEVNSKDQLIDFIFHVQPFIEYQCHKTWQKCPQKEMFHSFFFKQWQPLFMTRLQTIFRQNGLQSSHEQTVWITCYWWVQSGICRILSEKLYESFSQVLLIWTWWMISHCMIFTEHQTTNCTAQDFYFCKDCPSKTDSILESRDLIYIFLLLQSNWNVFMYLINIYWNKTMN